MNWLAKLWLRATGSGHQVDEWERWLERTLRVRRRAAELWLADGGHVPYRGELVHSFMVSEPMSRRKYERLAEREVVHGR